MRKSLTPPAAPRRKTKSLSAPSPVGHVPPAHRVPAHLARRFQQVCLGIASEVTEPAGLTPIEYAVLAALDDAPRKDQGSLAVHLGIDPVSTHHILHRLEAAGLVERQIDPGDRRARIIRLAPRGHTLRQKLRPAALA